MLKDFCGFSTELRHVVWLQGGRAHEQHPEKFHNRFYAPPSVHHITERGKIIDRPIVAVRVIVDGRKPDTQPRETDFYVKAHCSNE